MKYVLQTYLSMIFLSQVMALEPDLFEIYNSENATLAQTWHMLETENGPLKEKKETCQKAVKLADSTKTSLPDNDVKSLNLEVIDAIRKEWFDRYKDLCMAGYMGASNIVEKEKEEVTGAVKLNVVKSVEPVEKEAPALEKKIVEQAVLDEIWKDYINQMDNFKKYRHDVYKSVEKSSRKTKYKVALANLKSIIDKDPLPHYGQWAVRGWNKKYNKRIYNKTLATLESKKQSILAELSQNS